MSANKIGGSARHSALAGVRRSGVEDAKRCGGDFGLFVVQSEIVNLQSAISSILRDVMLPSPEELKTTLEQLLPGVSLTLEGGAFIVAPSDLPVVCRCLKDNERFSLDYLANLTAVDYPAEQRMDIIYHLYSMAKKHGPVTLKVKLNRSQPIVASVTPIWRGAEFQEREVYDLFGVRFEDHPDLRRILMWDGFEGHPMRKDYVVEDQDAIERPT